MALTRTGLALLLTLSAATSLFAQDTISEVSITAGVSSDQVVAQATQARIFGDTSWFRYYAEGAWSTLAASGDGHESEAFSTAYPYEGPPRVMDAYAEKFARYDRWLGSVRAGRFRTPFGISNASDHAYSGFLRAPLVRYEGYWALSNTFFEHGVNAMVGNGALQAEATIGRPADASDDQRRRAGTDTVLRLQAYHGPLVVGISHVRSQTYGDPAFASGQMVFSGVDARWMSGGVQLRGEWLFGRPWDLASTSGGYLDAFVHRSFMGPVTLVTRVETLDYTNPNAAYSSHVRGEAVGARVKVAGGLYGQVNVTHRPGEPYGEAVTATDVAFTYTVRYPR